MLKQYFLWFLVFSFCVKEIRAQHYEEKSILYNSLVGAVTGGVGSIINKPAGEKWQRAFWKGFTGGAGGGFLMYCGKKTNYLITQKKNISYAWLSRLVFSAGNSIVENAAASQPLLSRFHYDLGFIRIDFYTKTFKLMPRLMPSNLGSVLFLAYNGKLDLKTTLRSGTFVFRSPTIEYAPYLIGSTPGNTFILVDSLRQGLLYYEIFAHEMIHTFQFLEHSGFNNFFRPLKNEWAANSPRFKKWSKWIHGDLNYEIMLGNYFIVQGGYRRILYCRNFLENEAEMLSVRRVSCPADH